MEEEGLFNLYSMGDWITFRIKRRSLVDVADFLSKFEKFSGRRHAEAHLIDVAN